MNNTEADARLERQLAHALKSEPETWTPDCLASEQIIALAERTVPETEAAPLMAHVALCARCRHEYAETVELIQLSEEVSALKAQQEAVPAPAPQPAAAGQSTPPRHIPRPSLWQRIFGPGVGFALGAAAASLALFVAWNLPARVERSTYTSSLKERDIQIAQATQDKQKLEQQLTKERETQSALQRQLATATQQQVALKDKANRLAAAAQQSAPRPRSGEMVTDAAGQLALVVPLGATESQALATHHLTLPTQQIAALQSNRVQMGGHEKPNAVPLLSPVGTFVSSLRPTLRWKPFPDAARYEVRVADVAENTLKAHSVLQRVNDTEWSVSSSQPGAGQTGTETVMQPQGTEWTLSAQSALEPGKIYRWSVKAFDAGGKLLASEGEGRFGTLDAQAQEEIESKRRLYASVPLVLGTVYARYGLLAEAEAAFQQALANKPDDNTARQWLEQIRRSQAK